MSEEKKDILRGMGPGPILGISTRRFRRELTRGDYTRTRIGPAAMELSLDKIQNTDIKSLAKRYIDNVHDMIKSCTGLLLTGKPGVGKSAVAALIGLEAVRWRHTVYRATHEELQELRFDHKQEFQEEGQQVMDRIRSVDLLLLDNFNSDFASDKIFGPSKVEKLISLRNTARKPTIMTTRILVEDLLKDPGMKSMYGTMQETMVGAEVDGVDLRKSRNLEMKKRLGLD